MGFKLDFSNDTPEKVDSGGRIESGWYRAILDDVYEDHSNNDTVFKYVIQGGVYDGMVVWERLSDLDQVDDDKSKAVIISKAKNRAKRLGLLGDDVFGSEAEIEFADAIGKEVILQVESEYKDKNTGQMVSCSPRPGYAGVWTEDHPKLPIVAKKALGIALTKEEEEKEAAKATKAAGGKGGRTIRKASAATQEPVGAGAGTVTANGSHTPVAPGEVDVSDL